MQVRPCRRYLSSVNRVCLIFTGQIAWQWTTGSQGLYTFNAPGELRIRVFQQKNLSGSQSRTLDDHSIAMRSTAIHRPLSQTINCPRIPRNPNGKTIANNMWNHSNTSSTRQNKIAQLGITESLLGSSLQAAQDLSIRQTHKRSGLANIARGSMLQVVSARLSLSLLQQVCISCITN